MMPESVDEAKARGYRIISRRYRMASRIDRPDWKKVTRLGHANSDWYRRCESKDIITVPQSWIAELGNSIDGPMEFLP